MLLVSQRSSKNTLKLQFFYFYKYGCIYIDASSKLYDAALLILILHVLYFLGFVVLSKQWDLDRIWRAKVILNIIFTKL